ncbi:MAG TPA: LysM peptidoglycan-binding domain-containing protein [Cellvibrionaceae bacterium]
MTEATRLFILVLTVLLLQGCSQFSPFQSNNESSSLVVPTGAIAADNTEPPALVQLEPEPIPLPPADLWQRIRSGFALSEIDDQRIEQYVSWYSKHQRYIDRVSDRGQRYLYHIVERLEEEGLPLEIALLPVIESAFDPFAYSHGRASGMWQFLVGTGGDYGLRQSWWFDGRRDVIDSTEGAISYLKHLHQMFDNDWLLALAAYNTGQGNLRRAIARNKRAGKPTDFWSLQLPRETRAYVPQLLALSRVVGNPEKYGITLPGMPNQPYFVSVDTGSQIDLAEAAELAGISMDELYLLNPGFNRWATDPEGPHRLLLPVSLAEAFTLALAEIPAEQRISWQRYTIKSGDSLGKIARQYNTSIDALKIANQLKSTRIRAGASLLIPSAREPAAFYAHSQSQRLQQTQNQAQGAPGSQRIEYTVKSGDSFWRIANQHQVTVNALARWNGMAPRDTLRPGQKLVVWSQSAQTTTVANTQSNGVTRKLSYKVRQGDSLARIASRFNVSITDISRWNDVSTRGYIHPGQLLTLFVDVTKAR